MLSISEVLDNAYGEFEWLDTIEPYEFKWRKYRVRRTYTLNNDVQHTLLLKTNDKLKNNMQAVVSKDTRIKNEQNVVELIL